MTQEKMTAAEFTTVVSQLGIKGKTYSERGQRFTYMLTDFDEVVERARKLFGEPTEEHRDEVIDRLQYVFTDQQGRTWRVTKVQRADRNAMVESAY